MNTNNALLLVVHGSPVEESNDAVRHVLDQVRRAGAYDHVAISFLACNEPTISAAISDLASRGVRRIVAVPYFLHPGRHTALDIPRELTICADTYPNIQFLLGPIIGDCDCLTDVLRRRAAECAH